MIEILKLSPSNQRNKHYYSQILNYLNYKNLFGYSFLDIGGKSPLTESIIKEYKYLRVDNTSGDLDFFFVTIPMFKSLPQLLVYDSILYSHTIEHQFNPLNTLNIIKGKMDSDTRLFIIIPSRPKFLWSKQHFHEIDNYRMRLLLERAGIEIVSYERRKHWRPIKEYFGFRALLRLFFEFNAYYECKIKEI